MTEAQNQKRRFIEDVAARHGVGTDAVETLLRAVAAGGGTMAQFSHPELGGMGQWTRGGMIMVGDMFNQGLKYRVDTLCTEISDALYQNPALGAEPRPAGASGFSGIGAWWPSEFGSPSSSGAQNDLRYAFFPGARRLVIDRAGTQAVYDTGEHMISGVSQQQGGDQSLSFTSQFGTVWLSNLARIAMPASTSSTSGNSTNGDSNWANAVPEPAPFVQAPVEPFPVPPVPDAPHLAPITPPVAPAAPLTAYAADDIFALLERLADLKAKGILSEEEFSAKKTELLARL